MKPYSQACENNKQPILAVLSQTFANAKDVLEVGSGTGQHAVFFAANLPHLHWHTSDLAINHDGINAWIDALPSNNLHRPLTLDLNTPWPVADIDAIYSANTLHIISKLLVARFFEGVAKHLAINGKLCVYGPFNYQGAYTSESNAQFDMWLKERDANSGIRDIEWILTLAEQAGLNLLADHTMPANNRLLTFIKVT